jgi:2,5-diamino-6-(ribosylamino)-4(3H)-pyrimidinone 5'-phosphate reductase
MAKIGWNDKKDAIEKLPVSFVIVDNEPHLTDLGVSNLLQRVEKLYIVTTNENHPARKNTATNLEVIFCEGEVDLEHLFELISKLQLA